MLADRLILSGADGYDQARFAHIFNARRPERYPAAVLLADYLAGAGSFRNRNGWEKN